MHAPHCLLKVACHCHTIEDRTFRARPATTSIDENNKFACFFLLFSFVIACGVCTADAPHKPTFQFTD